MKTPTVVTFTSKISDPRLKPNSVILVRLDSSGRPVDIVGRLKETAGRGHGDKKDTGQRADADERDKTFTLIRTMNEPAVGPIQFKIAAQFRPLPPAKDDPDDDWDADLARLNDPKGLASQWTRLSPLLRKLSRYVLSDAFQVVVDPITLPPDPGDAGKQTLAGVDSDHDGVRDDVQRFIGLLYPNDSTKRQGLSQLAKVEQAFIVSPLEKPALIAIDEQRHLSHDCLEYLAGSRGLRDLAAALLSEVLNTPARSLAYGTASKALGPRLYVLTDESKLRLGCGF